MLAICVCVVLDRHLVICVGYMFVCVVPERHLVCLVLASGALGTHLMQEGSGPCPISCGVTGHVCSLWDMYA